MTRSDIVILIVVALAFAWGYWDRNDRKRWEQRVRETKRKSK